MSELKVIKQQNAEIIQQNEDIKRQNEEIVKIHAESLVIIKNIVKFNKSVGVQRFPLQSKEELDRLEEEILESEDEIVSYYY